MSSTLYGIDVSGIQTSLPFYRVNNNKNYGPYEFGGFLYDSGYWEDDGGVRIYAEFGLYKSADSITWTRVPGTEGIPITWLADYYPGSGSVIYFAYLQGYTPAGAIGRGNTPPLFDSWKRTAGFALWQTGGVGYAVSDTGTINGGTATYTITSVDSGGSVTGISFVSGGANAYSVSHNVATTTGGGQPGVGTGLVVNINSVSGGNITALSIGNSKGGTGYALNDTGTVNGGTSPASYRVNAVDHGVVTGIDIFPVQGAGYSIASNVGTTPGGSQPGVGSGLTLDIVLLYGIAGGQGTTPNIQLMSFDMATDTVTVIDTNGPQLELTYQDQIEPNTSAGEPAVTVQLNRLPNGTFVLEYVTCPVSLNYDIYVVTYNGSWGTPAQLNTNAPAQSGYCAFGIGVTPNNKAYCLWISGDDGWIYSSLLDAGILSAPVLASGSITTASNLVAWSTKGNYISSSDDLVFNCPTRAFGVANVKILIISSASGTASYALVDTGAVFTGGTGTHGEMAFIERATNDYAIYFFDTQISSPQEAFVDVTEATALTGPWSAQAVYLDIPIVNPLSPPITFLALQGFIDQIDVSILDGVPAFIIGFEVQLGAGPAGVSGPAYFYGPVPTPPPPTTLTIACPVGGNVATVGVPYSAQIVVTGGTPPYTFMLL